MERVENALQYGHYRVLENERGAPWMLGHGAMGITYKAEDTNLRVPVALKVISPLIAESPGAKELFLSEARGAASLRHRNAAAVHHLGVDSRSELFFAMEFIAGETVDALITRQRWLDVPLALDIAQQTACALAAAHGRQLIHRDLKPANLMLSDEGDGTLVVKVIDFGLCKVIARKADGKDGEAEQFFGTLHYASPEQIRCEPTLDGRSDFYALGATLWKMLTGRPVFEGSLASIRQRHLAETPPFDELPGEVSPPVRDLLASLLSKDPARRPQTPLELIDRIELAGYEHRGAEADPRRHWKTQGCVPLIGSLLAHNYHLEALADESQAGAAEPVFRAEDVAGGRRVAVQLLDRHQPLEAVRAGGRAAGGAAASEPRAEPRVFQLPGTAVSRQRVDRWFSVERVAARSARRFEAGGGLAFDPAGCRGLRAQPRAWTRPLGVSSRPAALAFQRFNDSETVAPRSFGTPNGRLAGFFVEAPDQDRFFHRVAPASAEATVQKAVRGLGDLTARLLGGSDESTLAFDEVSSGAVNDEAGALSAVHVVLDQTTATPPVFASITDFVAALTAAFETGATGLRPLAEGNSRACSKCI